MSLRLSANSLDWALAHIKLLGDTDIFPIPFEFQPIEYFWHLRNDDLGKQRIEFRKWLSSIDLANWTLRPSRRAMSPKHQFGFRASTQLDPLDALLYSALVFELGNDLEAARVPASLQIAHSHRFSPTSDGQMFDPAFGYDSFRRRSLHLASQAGTEYVVSADIADFFPRLYSHPLENALAAATTKSAHVNAVRRLLSQLNHRVSYGIPVGPAASRLLAELAIADIDQALIAEGFEHTRFVDDFRLFCASERDAYSALAFLADSLFEHHGLTLQQHKTFIQPAAEFVSQNSESESDREYSSLSEKFEAILRNLGINNPYEPINYFELDKETQLKIDELNLVEIVREQIASDQPIDFLVTKSVLRRLAQVGNREADDDVLENINRLYPVFKDAVAYLAATQNIDPSTRHQLGKRLLELIRNEVVGHLEFHRAWIISIFSEDSIWNNAELFIPLFTEFDDPLTRREIILSLGRAGKAEWFKSRKRRLGELEPWQRRAFLAAASCLPGDEALHWYGAVAVQLDELEKGVVDWVVRFPFV